jgi:predicted O-methyltransferase YrrM
VVQEVIQTRAAIAVAGDHFKGRDDLFVCEIGVQRGINAENILSVLNPRLMVLVDCWHVEDGEDHGKDYVETWKRFHGLKHVIVIKGWSVDVAEILNLKFDLVYIDAGHDAVSIPEDIEAWLPKVKPGGMICGHDYFNHPAVKEAVDKTFGEKLNFGQPPDGWGSDWWVFL